MRLLSEVQARRPATRTVRRSLLYRGTPMPDYSADGAAVGGRGLHRGKPASTLLSEKGLRQRLTLLAVAPTASVTAAAAGAYAACVGSDSAAVAWGAGAGATVLCGSAIGLAW